LRGIIEDGSGESQPAVPIAESEPGGTYFAEMVAATLTAALLQPSVILAFGNTIANARISGSADSGIGMVARCCHNLPTHKPAPRQT